MPDAKKQLRVLHKSYPKLRHYLNFKTPLQLLVATILSAQVRDERVNEATPELFKKYGKAKDYANAKKEDIVDLIRHISFAGKKADYIRKACKIIAEKHSGKVPKSANELIKLPGIGRKTANAILQYAYGIVEGVVVDTHVLRVAYRLGWTTIPKNADRAEKDIMKIIPKKEWMNIPALMKNHGRAICTPVPKCSVCPLNEICPREGVEKSK